MIKLYKNKKLIIADIGKYSHIGQVRSNNEDSFIEYINNDPHPYNVQGMIAVADGMGGHLSGEIASKTVVNLWQKVFVDPKVVRPIAENDFIKLLDWELKNIHKKINEMSSNNKEYKNMGSTLVSVILRDNNWYIVNVGDSRAYIIRDNAIYRVSEDDSVIGQLLDEGKISEEQARLSPFKNQLSQAIGCVETITPHISIEQAYKNDTILICSDGLTEYVTEQEILEIFNQVNSCQDLVDILGEIANSRGGKDNITVMAIKADYKIIKHKKEMFFQNSVVLSIIVLTFLCFMGLFLIFYSILLPNKSINNAVVPIPNSITNKNTIGNTKYTSETKINIKFQYLQNYKKINLITNKWIPLTINDIRYSTPINEISLSYPVDQDWIVNSLSISREDSNITVEFDRKKAIWLNDTNKIKKVSNKYILPIENLKKITFYLKNPKKINKIEVSLDIEDIKTILNN